MDDILDNKLAVPALPLEKALEKKTFANRIRKIKHCTERCPVYDFCPVMPMAQNSKEQRKPCALKSMPLKMKKRFERLFLNGQDGMVQELLSALYSVGLKTELDGDLADHRAYAHLITSTMKALYGDKIELSGEQSTTVTVNVISLEDSLPRMKEIPEGDVIDITPKRKKTEEEMLKDYEANWRE